MKRFLPGSLSGQLALVMAGALLIASVVNFVLLIGERQRAALVEQSVAPIARFADVASTVFADPPDELGRGFGGGRGRGPSRYLLLSGSPVDEYALPRDLDIEQRLAKALDDSGVATTGVRASVRTFDRPDRLAEILQGLGRGNRDSPGTPADRTRGDDRARATDRVGPPAIDVGRAPPDGPPPQMLSIREIILSAKLSDGRWMTSLTFAPEATRGDLFLLGASTFVIFVCVLGAALWVASRLARPLRDLAEAAARVGETNEPQQVSARAPGDVQQTIEAFNAMSRRVSQLLREKDVMLGALGHDLRTPLASLRIRIESMEPEAERLKAVRTIEEASHLLEDILELSRQGNSREPERTMDVSMIVQDMAEDYSETGAPVTTGETQRAVAVCRPVLLRRALRNLIDNALGYGGNARLSVEPSGGRIRIHVDDDGPGMPDETLASATAPFYRGESSRNRETGGAGLGLTLTEAIARAHSGTLVLNNRESKGLRATIELPIAATHAATAPDAR